MNISKTSRKNLSIFGFGAAGTKIAIQIACKLFPKCLLFPEEFGKVFTNALTTKN